MEIEEDKGTEAAKDNINNPILHVIVVGFHHKKGCQVEYAYPPLIEGNDVNSSECPEEWKNLPSLALPDGAHNYADDIVYFHLPSRSSHKSTIYCVSCYRQMNSMDVINRSSDVTRSSVQKSVCVLSSLPAYGLIQTKLEMITHAYFKGRDFSQVDLLRDTYLTLNMSIREGLLQDIQILHGLSCRELLQQFQHRVLILFKLMLLERRVLFISSPVKPVCKTLLTVLSLFPGMIEHGLVQAVNPTPDQAASPALTPVSQPVGSKENLNVIPETKSSSCDVNQIDLVLDQNQSTETGLNEKENEVRLCNNNGSDISATLLRAKTNTNSNRSDLVSSCEGFEKLDCNVENLKEVVNDDTAESHGTTTWYVNLEQNTESNTSNNTDRNDTHVELMQCNDTSDNLKTLSKIETSVTDTRNNTLNHDLNSLDTSRSKSNTMPANLSTFYVDLNGDMIDSTTNAESSIDIYVNSCDHNLSMDISNAVGNETKSCQNNLPPEEMSVDNLSNNEVGLSCVGDGTCSDGALVNTSMKTEKNLSAGDGKVKCSESEDHMINVSKESQAEKKEDSSEWRHLTLSKQESHQSSDVTPESFGSKSVEADMDAACNDDDLLEKDDLIDWEVDNLLLEINQVLDNPDEAPQSPRTPTQSLAGVVGSKITDSLSSLQQSISARTNELWRQTSLGQRSGGDGPPTGAAGVGGDSPNVVSNLKDRIFSGLWGGRVSRSLDETTSPSASEDIENSVEKLLAEQGATSVDPSNTQNVVSVENTTNPDAEVSTGLNQSELEASVSKHDSFQELTMSVESIHSTLSDVVLPFEQDEHGMPLALFVKGSVCHPYISLHYYDILTNKNIKGLLIGASNALFKQKTLLLDVMVELSDAHIEINDAELRRQLTLSTADLRFADFLVKSVSEEKGDIFLDETGWEGGDDWLRSQFRSYLYAMLSAASNENERLGDDFNSSFILALKKTTNYKIWKSSARPAMKDVLPEHPFHGQLSMSDVKLKFSQVIQNADRNKKLNSVVYQTNQVVAQTGKAVGGAITSAKSAVVTWFGGFSSQKS